MTEAMTKPQRKHPVQRREDGQGQDCWALGLQGSRPATQVPGLGKSCNYWSLLLSLEKLSSHLCLPFI